MLRTFAAAALLALIITPIQAVTSAQADAWSDASVPVVYGDLNLAKPADAKILADRLQAAANRACIGANRGLTGSEHIPLDAVKTEMRACINEAIDVAMLRIEKNVTRNVRANLISDKQASLN
jgi:UrcA family protein